MLGFLGFVLDITVAAAIVLFIIVSIAAVFGLAAGVAIAIADYISGGRS